MCFQKTGAKLIIFQQKSSNDKEKFQGKSKKIAFRLLSVYALSAVIVVFRLPPGDLFQESPKTENGIAILFFLAAFF